VIRRILEGLFRTQLSLSEADYRRAGRGLIADGVCSTSMATLQGGPFLAAFAIALGASNYEVGLLATIGFLSQFAQVGGLMLVERYPRRRGIVFVGAAASRVTWLLIILIPVLFVGRGVTFLMQWLLLAAVIGAVAGPAWNSLIREVVPPERMGRLFSRRMAVSTAFALGLTLAGGYFVDLWKGWFPDAGLYAYSILFALGLAFGVAGLAAIARLPDPAAPARRPEGIVNLLLQPGRDTRFRGLLLYIAAWNFAINLAGPFFIVYLLQRIELPLGMVTALVVTSQVANLIFLRIWGKLADRYSNKSVLRVSGPLFLLAILLWTFTTLPERHLLTLPLLFVIHVLTGVSVAGVSLASANIALKLSPQGQAQSYMTLYGLAGAATGAVAPMLGGVFADFFAARELNIQLGWAEPEALHQVYALNLRALDFLFVLAFLVGWVSLRFLRKVPEEGEVDEKVVRDELLSETFATFRVISTVPGLRHLVAGPVSAAHRLVRAVSGAAREGPPQPPAAQPDHTDLPE
jgi:MFS family permease